MRRAPRILLLQARHRDDPARSEERETFALRCGLDLESIVPFDLLEGAPTLEAVRGCDALMVGGSGDFYVSKGNLPFLPALLETLREVVEVGHPTFASCFGFQLLVEALGGEVIHDPENTEVGTYPLHLTPEGRADPLFRHLGSPFAAQLGRKDRASELPASVVNLASSERAPFQALRVPDRPIWASQFHPELDRKLNLGRFETYMEGYAGVMSVEEREAARRRFAESPETLELLPRFLELVLGWTSHLDTPPAGT